MLLSSVYSSFHEYFLCVPGIHWVIMIALVLALIAVLVFRKKYSVYSCIVLGLTVLTVLFLVDLAVLTRFGSKRILYHDIDLHGEFQRLVQLLHGNERLRILMFFNMVVFAPFGFFFSEFISSTTRLSAWRRLGYATLASFGLSLCIECLQLFLRVGFFELTDLVLNTAGGFIGAGLALLGRKVLGIGKKCEQ